LTSLEQKSSVRAVPGHFLIKINCADEVRSGKTLHHFGAHAL
jgi:hypothetical protein